MGATLTMHQMLIAAFNDSVCTRVIEPLVENRSSFCGLSHLPAAFIAEEVVPSGSLGL